MASRVASFQDELEELRIELDRAVRETIDSYNLHSGVHADTSLLAYYRLVVDLQEKVGTLAGATDAVRDSIDRFSREK